MTDNPIWEFFYQTEFWVTGDGQHVPISELDKDHALNILKFLERKAPEQAFAMTMELIDASVGEYSDEVRARKAAFGGPIEWHEHLTKAFIYPSLEFVKDTPLYKAIERQAQ